VSTLSDNGKQVLSAALETTTAQAPDPQVIPGNSGYGNRYPRAYKLKILREADACTKPGQLGQLLRRAGISHATLTSFRKQQAAGTLEAPGTNGKRKATATSEPENTKRVLELERENRKLKRQLQQAEAIIDVQKKVSRLLEISLDRPED
jgi:transposase